MTASSTRQYGPKPRTMEKQEPAYLILMKLLQAEWDLQNRTDLVQNLPARAQIRWVPARSDKVR